MISTSELVKYRKHFEKELKENILSYWIRYSVNPKTDGFYGAVDLDGNPVTTANISCVLASRILWTFSAASKKYEDFHYNEMAERAYRVLMNHFLDKKNGGYYMEITPANRVADDIKHTYAQAFVIYALCKRYEWKPSVDLLATISGFFELLETKAKDPENPGYFEAFSREWKSYEENRMADNDEPRSMNTHLHLLEAYAALYKVWKDDKVKVRLSELIILFQDRIIREDGHLGIFFNEHFEETESSKGTCSFGHDIEASWLLWEAAEILNDQKILNRMRSQVIKMVKAVERVGLDKDGGLFLESTRFGSHLRTNKHWWPQAENLVGFMNVYQLTREEKHWDTVKLAWNFINKYLIDHERGEWYTKVNRLGEPYLVEPEDDPSPYYRNDWKIDPWKCPYHNGRAMMELIQRIDNTGN